MNTVVTFANYDFTDRNYFGLAKMWLRSVRRNHDGRIVLISKQPVDNYLKGIVPGVDFWFEPSQSPNVIANFENKVNFQGCESFALHNVYYKLYHLCRLNFPFILLDMDMCVLSSLQKLEQICEGRRYSVVEHRNFHNFPGPDHFMNGGLQVVNDPSILNWSEIVRMVNAPDYQKIIYGAEQSILYNYFEHIGYDYRAPGLTEHWNAFIDLVELRKEEGEWRAYLDGEPAHILHYCGRGYKPWVIDCPLYQAMSC